MEGSRNQKQFSRFYDIYIGITTRPQWVGWLTTDPIRWASKNKRQTPENSFKWKIRVDTKIIGELQGRGNQNLRGQQAEGSKPANWWTEKLNEGIVGLYHILPRMQSDTFTDIKVDLKSFSERNTEIAKRKSIFA